MTLPPPVFTSFDDAWRWFVDGGALVPLEEQRARFTEGRAQFLSFQARVTDPNAVDLARDVQDALEEIKGVTPFPDDLLHISVLGAGFQVIEARRPNDVLRQDVPSIAERAAKALRSAKPVDVELGPVNVFPDALILEVHDASALSEIRRALESATRPDAFGFDETTYLPHTTIATFADASASGALRAALPPLRERAPVAMRVARIELARWWLTGLDLSEPPETDVIRSYALRG